MNGIPDLLTDRALNTEWIEPGFGQGFADGLVHKKFAPCIIIAQAIQGSYEVVGRGGSVTASGGEAFLSATHEWLTITHHGDPQHGGRFKARWLHVHFTLYDTIDVSSLLKIPLKCDKTYGRKFGTIIEELLESQKGEKEFNPLGRWVRRKELAFQALRLLCEISTFKKESLDFIRLSERLIPVFTYVKKNLHRSISVRELAEIAHMSASRFHVFFLQRVRQTPMDYVKTIRLTTACNKIIASDASMAQIAQSVGFCNQFHFSREFKNRFGVSPSAYKSTHQKFTDF